MGTKMSVNKMIIDDLTNKNEKDRKAIAVKVGRSLSKDLDKVERAAVEELARALVVDAATNVRQSLMKEILTCPFLPSDVAKEISNDVESVSKKFLLQYDGDDEFLEKLVHDCEDQACQILATRENLPEGASFAISEVGSEESISNLMKNQTANISERVCSTVTDRFKDNSDIMENMSKRADLPLSSVVKLVDFLSEELASDLVKEYHLGEDLAHYIAGEAKLSSVESAVGRSTEEEVESYLRGLNANGLLNDGMLLQILKGRDVRKFVVAVSVRTGISKSKIKAVLDSGDKGHFFRLMDKLKVTSALGTVLHEAYTSALQPKDG